MLHKINFLSIQNSFPDMCFKRQKKYDITQTKDRLRQLTAVSELATTEYTIAKVVKAELLSKTESLALEELLRRYAKVITSIVSKYFVKGEGEEDISQEARLALINAVKSFNGESSFKNYASKCIKNRVLTLIKKANRLKNLPLYDYVPLTGFSEGEDADKNKILPCVKSSPEEHFIERESANELLTKIKQVLSKYE